MTNDFHLLGPGDLGLIRAGITRKKMGQIYLINKSVPFLI